MIEVRAVNSELILQGCNYDRLMMNRPVISLNSLPTFIWIDLDADLIRDCTLYQLDEISLKFPRPVDFQKMVIRDRHLFKVTSGILNRSSGLHTYKMSFVNTKTNDVVEQYFSYVIQDDHVYKPYDYMSSIRQGEKCDGCNIFVKDVSYK